MGEQTSKTSKYDSMTPAQVAATLTTPMINALDTGRNDNGTAAVLGRSGTIVALIERGLVTAGREHRWTERGFAVAALVLYGNVPTYRPPQAERVAAAQAEMRTLDGYYDVAAGRVPRPLDIVQLPHAVIGVVERVNVGGDALVRTNTSRSTSSLEAHPVDRLRSVPPIAYELAGVPGALTGDVPRDFATSELLQRAIMRARQVAPRERLTLAAIKTDNRYEYGRAYVYAIASIIDATRLVAAHCGNKQWHESAPARRLQRCTSCDDVRVPARTSAVEILADGEQVPVGKPRETTISRGALDELIADAQRITEGIADLTELVAAEQAKQVETDPATDDDVQQLVDRIIRRAQYLALHKVLEVLDGWREGVRSNHDALGHRGENRDEHCWDHWHTDDVRRMVTGAANELRTADPALGHTPIEIEP